MSFKGLFIGIDRYASPGVNWLRFARRDAAALYGPFTDLMAGDTVMLTDEQASRAEIEEEFRRLEGAATDISSLSRSPDMVQKLTNLSPTTPTRTTFRAHRSRSQTWRMVRTHPTPPAANRARLSFFRRMGAKALQVDVRATPFESVDAELNRISGEGRAVLTASGPTQPAWESSRSVTAF